MTTGIELIVKERNRQIEEEGYTKDQDKFYNNRELGEAGACYAIMGILDDTTRDKARSGLVPLLWPWDYLSWKPSMDNSNEGRVRDLTKAAALLAAELDRLLLEMEGE